MNSYKDAINHMIAWNIRTMGELQKDAQEIMDDEDLTDAAKARILRGKNGLDYQLLNLMVQLKPALAIAREEFPRQEQFFSWFDERWQHIIDNKYVSGDCGCKGCNKEQHDNMNES